MLPGVKLSSVVVWLLASLLAGCGKADSGKAKGVPSYMHDWPRPQYQPGGSNALVSFVLYGRFKEGAEVSAKTYRTMGFPQGVDLRHLTREQVPQFPCTEDAFAKTAGKDNPALFQQVRTAAECLVFQGELPDPHDLNFLRDLTGLIMFSLDHGAIAVMDVQQLKLYDRATWRQEMFEPDPPNLSGHAVILISDEADGTQWFHSRGMRKFGRPDLSFHQVPHNLEKPVTELFNRFIQMQAQGGLIIEGQEIRMASLPAGLVCRHAGTTEDPDFNNVHVEITWPKH